MSNTKKTIAETKTEIFIRLAKPRVERVLKALSILSNCSNRSNYEYTQEQIDKIFNTLNEAIIETEKKFTKSKKEAESFEF